MAKKGTTNKNRGPKHGGRALVKQTAPKPTPISIRRGTK